MQTIYIKPESLKNGSITLNKIDFSSTEGSVYENTECTGKYAMAEGGLDYEFSTKNVSISSLENSINDYIYSYNPNTFNSELVQWCIDNQYPINTLIEKINQDTKNVEGYETVFCTNYNSETHTITFSGPLHTEAFTSQNFPFIIKLKEGKTISSALGDASHSEGCSTANGIMSHSENTGNAFGDLTHAEGQDTKAYGYASHAEGDRSVTSPTAAYAHVEGHFCIAEGAHSHAEGNNTKAVGEGSHAEGYNVESSGKHSHAEGGGTKALGQYSSAKGYNSKATGNCSHAEGGAYYINSSGKTQKLNGGNADGHGSHAEGIGTESIGLGSHAEGKSTHAIGIYSHAEGLNTYSQGQYSHAEGGGNTANGDYSHAEGYNTVANNMAEFACGKYNNSTDRTLFSVGSGTSKIKRNALEIANTGDVYIENGSLLVGTGNTASSKGTIVGGKYNDDNGALFCIGDGNSESRKNALELIKTDVVEEPYLDIIQWPTTIVVEPKDADGNYDQYTFVEDIVETKKVAEDGVKIYQLQSAIRFTQDGSSGEPSQSKWGNLLSKFYYDPDNRTDNSTLFVNEYIPSSDHVFMSNVKLHDLKIKLRIRTHSEFEDLPDEYFPSPITISEIYINASMTTDEGETSTKKFLCNITVDGQVIENNKEDYPTGYDKICVFENMFYREIKVSTPYSLKIDGLEVIHSGYMESVIQRIEFLENKIKTLEQSLQ